MSISRRLVAVVSGSALTLSMLTGFATGAHSGEVRGGPVGVASEKCDPTGDGDADDCLRHGHHKGASDHVLNGDDKLIVRGHAHPALHNKKLRTEVQVRAIDWSGKPTGPWVTQGTFMWNTDNKGGSHERKTFSVCAPEKTGLYQVRKKVTVPKVAESGRSVRSSIRTGDTYTSAPTTVASNGPNCSNDPDMEELIEYFNMINFNGDFVIEVTASSGSSTSFVINCPPLEEPMPAFNMVLSTLNGSASTNCGTTVPVTLNPATDANCSASGYCNFTVVYSEAATGIELSSSIVSIFAKRTEVLIPELEPATLPICANTLNNCLELGSCNYSAGKEGSIQLCEAASCDAPSFQASQPSLNSSEQVTFVAVVDSEPSSSPSPSASPSPSPTPSASPSPTPTPTPTPTPNPSAS